MKAFLAAHGWAEARQTPLAGDASMRRYWRLVRGAETAILMIDPVGDVARFAQIARHLGGLGLSAPRILAADPARGVLLLEDLGDGLVARRATDGARERALYRAACDALAVVQAHPAPPGLDIATPERLAGMIAPAFTDYAGRPAPSGHLALMAQRLERHAPPEGVMVLRDFHAENILDLEDRSGPARIGLLDFQDALEGHAAYDLASLLRDARRDLRTGTAAQTRAHFLAITGRDEAAFGAAFAVLSVQRNLRILGIFARLARAGKPGYLRLVPRVWRHIATDLAHPAAAPLAALLEDLPDPTPRHLDGLRTPCPAR